MKALTHTLLLLALLLASACQAQPLGRVGERPLRTGAEVLMGSEQLPQGRYAVVGNQSSLVGSTHLVDTLLACGVNVVKIFCPEHGFRGKAEAGAHVDNETDAKTGLPIVSLYGKNKKPTPDQMKDLDGVLFDLQDVGCRFYTYISTLHYVMEACAERGIPCVVLDRPNPNGHYVDGPVLDMKYQSFIGMHPVPIVYGLTIGEYAQMINGERWLKDSLLCNLDVVPMDGYRRDSSYALPVPPSPNLQTLHSILLYPSLCLFEGTNVSVGRGTDTPFEIVGAPEAKVEAVEAGAVRMTFVPHPIKGVSENPPYKGQSCQGLDLRRVAVPACFDLRWLLTMHRAMPRGTFFKRTNGFEKLAGNDQLRKQIEAGMSEEAIRATWQPALTHYKSIRQKYLLYPDVE